MKTPHEEVTPLACHRRGVPAVRPDSTVIGGRNMRSIVDQNGKIVFQHDGEGQYEEIDRTVARLLNAAS